MVLSVHCCENPLNFECTRFKQSYERKHAQQNACLSVFCRSGEISFAIGIKRAEGIFMKFRICIRCFLNESHCYRHFEMLTPKRGLGGD